MVSRPSGVYINRTSCKRSNQRPGEKDNLQAIKVERGGRPHSVTKTF